MGECIITRRGGSSAKAFAVIHVDYPAGSICTCTNGTKTLKAKDTSGVWNFLVPESGNWIVASHTTGKEKSQTVAISSQGQAEKITLAYYVSIWENGDGIAAFQSLFTRVNGSPTIADDGNGNAKLTFPTAGQNHTTIASVDAYDLSPYNALKVGIKVNSGTGWVTVNGQRTSSSGGSNIHASWSHGTLNESSFTERIIDVSSINSSDYIQFWGANNGTNTISYIRLE